MLIGDLVNRQGGPVALAEHLRAVGVVFKGPGRSRVFRLDKRQETAIATDEALHNGVAQLRPEIVVHRVIAAVRHDVSVQSGEYLPQ